MILHWPKTSITTCSPT